VSTFHDGDVTAERKIRKAPDCTAGPFYLKTIERPRRAHVGLPSIVIESPCHGSTYQNTARHHRTTAL
jgi:hypothetical protein